MRCQIALTVVSVAWWTISGGNAAAVDAKPETNSVSEKTGNLTLPSLCTVCNCTGAAIDCGNRGLKDHFQDSQWPNASISEVSFLNDSLVHLRPFPRLPIAKLVLRCNQITKIDNSAFKELINLTELDLSHNQLSSELLQPHVFQGRFSPEAYEPLAKLTKLDLSYNLLHSLHQDLFEHLPNLKILNLAGNPIDTIDLRTSMAISSTVYVEELDLSDCGLKTIPSSQFRTLRHLRKLDLSRNRLAMLPAALDEATTLESLRLDENPITTIDHVHTIAGLSNLKNLSLQSMPVLHAIGKGGLSSFSGLENLWISDCPYLDRLDENAFVRYEGDSALWPPLKRVDLSVNALRYLPALLIGRWDQLEELNLTGNKWSCDCENQYLIGSILPKYGMKLMTEADLDRLTCSAPPELEGRNFTSLEHSSLRCLDIYDARPEKDAAILVGLLIGVLLAIPLALAVFLLWRRGFLFCGSQGPASFSRAFYKRAANDEDL